MSVFVATSLKKFPYQSEVFTSARGAAHIVAAGSSGTLVVYKYINGVGVEVLREDIICNPALCVDVGIGVGADFVVCVIDGDGCIQLDIVDVNYSATPKLDLDALAASISNPIVTAINSQTTDLQAALLAQTTSITASIQSIVDTLDAGITVNAVQSGTWSFTVDGQPIEVSLDAATLTELQNILETSDITVQIGGQDTTLDVNITNQPIAVTVDLQPVIDAIQAVVRVDYESTGYCVLDTNGDKVPMVGVFSQVRYDATGAVVSTELVLSELVGITWQAYTLPSGFTVSECPIEAVAEIVAVPDGSDIPNSTTFTFPFQQVRTFTVVREGAGDVVIDFGNGRQITMDRNGTRTFGNGDGASLLDVSGVSITTGATSNAEVTWENV